MFWNILHRMIFLELVRIFLLALVALTGLLMIAGVVSEATQRGLPPAQILTVLPLLIPSTLPYTIPTTTLFATCVVYGRLAADNEILALKAAGINMMHVIWPALLLGGGSGVATLVMFVDLIPSTTHELRNRFFDDMEEYLYTALRKQGCLRHGKIDYEIYVKRLDGRKMIDAIFARRDPKTKNCLLIARAREAELLVDRKRNQIMVHMRHCHIVGENGRDEAFVQDKFWPVDLPSDFGVANKNNPRMMTWWELFDHRDRLKQEQVKAELDAAAHQAQINQGTAPAGWSDVVNNRNEVSRHRKRLILGINAELQMRPALALGCLFFVLIGCPVGIWFSKSDYLSAFITCFLPIVLLYYPLLLCGINFAKGGRVEPGLILWLPNALMGLIALFMFRRLLKN